MGSSVASQENPADFCGAIYSWAAQRDVGVKPTSVYQMDLGLPKNRPPINYCLIFLHKNIIKNKQEVSKFPGESGEFSLLLSEDSPSLLGK